MKFVAVKKDWSGPTWAGRQGGDALADTRQITPIALVAGAQANFWQPRKDGAVRHARHAISIGLHAALFGTIYLASLHAPVRLQEERPLELVLETPVQEAPAPPAKLDEPPPAPPAPAEDVVAAEKPRPKPLRPKPPRIVKSDVRPTSPAPALPSPSTASAAPTQAPSAPPPPKSLPSSYVSRIYERVSKAASGNYPRSALMRQLEGRVAYTLVIGADGQLLSYTVEPSGKEVFDKAAAAAIEAAAPYPAPPELGAKAYQLHGVIAYQLSDE